MEAAVRNKSLLNSLNHKITETIRRPVPTILTLSMGRRAKPEIAARCSRKVLHYPTETFYTFYKELYQDGVFWEEIKNKLNDAKSVDKKVSGWINFDAGSTLYILARIFKPKIIVETGVGPGGSTSFLLNALQKNEEGILYSIDLPGFDSLYYPNIGKHYDVHVPTGFTTGWLVPQRLRNRWTLILGNTKTELPKLLEKLSAIDIFIHDSLHTYDHMMFEYSTAWPHLPKGGLLLSDDVNPYWSLAFPDFCRAKKSRFCLVDSLGITMKL